MTNTPKLKDVARLAEVSEMTASRALRGVGDVSESTRKRVVEAALAIGYVPNKLAGNLASRTSNLIGVIVPSLSSFVFPEVLNGISATLEGSGLQPVTGVTSYDLDKEEEVIRQMMSWRPRGLIIAGLEHTEGARRILASASAPIVRPASLSRNTSRADSTVRIGSRAMRPTRPGAPSSPARSA